MSADEITGRELKKIEMVMIFMKSRSVSILIAWMRNGQRKRSIKAKGAFPTVGYTE